MAASPDVFSGGCTRDWLISLQAVLFNSWPADVLTVSTVQCMLSLQFVFNISKRQNALFFNQAKISKDDCAPYSKIK